MIKFYRIKIIYKCVCVCARARARGQAWSNNKSKHINIPLHNNHNQIAICNLKRYVQLLFWRMRFYNTINVLYSERYIYRHLTQKFLSLAVLKYLSYCLATIIMLRQNLIFKEHIRHIRCIVTYMCIPMVST